MPDELIVTYVFNMHIEYTINHIEIQQFIQMICNMHIYNLEHPCANLAAKYMSNQPLALVEYA